jgi:hypothetical protein
MKLRTINKNQRIEKLVMTENIKREIIEEIILNKKSNTIGGNPVNRDLVLDNYRIFKAVFAEKFLIPNLKRKNNKSIKKFFYFLVEILYAILEGKLEVLPSR